MATAETLCHDQIDAPSRLGGHVDIVSRTEVKGWAIDWARPNSKVEVAIILNGNRIGTCWTDIHRAGLREILGAATSGVHEFRYVFNPPLDSRIHHHIEVVSADTQELLPNGRHTIYRPSNVKSLLTPILLTSNGRSGSTMLMREFATHPEISVANVYPFEVKLASYYAAAWQVLTQTTHDPTQQETDFAERANRELVIGRNPWNRQSLWDSVGGAADVELMGSVVPDRMAQFLNLIINEHYSLTARANRKSARFFAEKSVLGQSIRQTYRVLFPEMKEIVLVRDPRDHLCSARTFWNHDVATVIATQQSELPILTRIYKENRRDVLFVRYEDLILKGDDTRREMYKFIGCDPDFQPHEVPADGVPVTHRTSNSAAASIGRFRKELDNATLRSCNEHFGSYLTLFGYPH